MFDIEFYENPRGEKPVKEWIEELGRRAETDKRARVLLKQVFYNLSRLRVEGTRAPENIVKHIDGDIYELRPGNHRIMFFGWNGNKFVLLHTFLKTTNETPKREIETAKRRMRDWKNRRGD